MLTRIREFLKSTPGKIVAICLVGLVLVITAVNVLALLGDDSKSNSYTTYICTETLKTFRHKNEIGESIPILSPYSGKNTGVPAEPCYWTRDGGTKSEPTWVLVNEAIGSHEPTFCPDCGRLVRPRNPAPTPGATPPPTREEYQARHPADAEGPRDDRR
jgi:hypothetical protein